MRTFLIFFIYLFAIGTADAQTTSVTSVSAQKQIPRQLPSKKNVKKAPVKKIIAKKAIAKKLPVKKLVKKKNVVRRKGATKKKLTAKQRLAGKKAWLKRRALLRKGKKKVIRPVAKKSVKKAKADRAPAAEKAPTLFVMPEENVEEVLEIPLDMSPIAPQEYDSYDGLAFNPFEPDEIEKKAMEAKRERILLARQKAKRKKMLAKRKRARRLAKKRRRSKRFKNKKYARKKSPKQRRATKKSKRVPASKKKKDLSTKLN